MIEIINKPLLLHLVGYLYYWQMGFNSVFKGLMEGPVLAGSDETTLQEISLLVRLCVCPFFSILSRIRFSKQVQCLSKYLVYHFHILHCIEQRPVADSAEYGNDFYVSIDCREITV